MTTQMLLCPGCRARVLDSWTECKFCGESLAAEPIGATVHPDDLAAQALGAAPAHGAAPEPGATSSDAAPAGDGHYDWSQWVNDPGTPEVPEVPATVDAPQSADVVNDFDYPVPPEPPDWDALAAPEASGGSAESLAPPQPTSAASSWDEGPQERAGLHVAPTPEPPLAGSSSTVPVDAPDAGWGAPDAPDAPPHPAESQPDPWQSGDAVAPGAALEPVQGTSSQWAAGPAPVVSGADDDLGPSGLDPVSWYTDPSHDAGSTPGSSGDGQASSGPSLFGDRTGGAAAGAAGASQAGATFDAGAIFRDDPEPAAAAGTLQRQAPPGEVAIAWTPAADAWNEPAEPEGTPKGQPVLSRETRLLAFGILALVVIGLLANAALERRNNFPANWTPDVQGVASWVSSRRDLPFKHPISVRTVDANEYAREVAMAQTAPDDKAKQALADRVAALRALGAVEGNPAATMTPALLAEAGSGAFYDVRKGRLVLRAGTNPAQLKAAVAGALSMALDDQYADLSGVDSTSLSENTLASVVAGGADLVRTEWVAAQPADVRAELTAQEARSRPIGTSFERARARLAVGTGRSLVQLVRDVRSTDDLNQLTELPPGSDLQVLDPTVYLDGQRPLVVDAPAVPADATRLDSGTVGAATWYLLIAERLDAQRAFAAVDGWSGDSFVTYRKANGQVCISDVLRAADETTAGSLLGVLQAWQSKVPGDHIKSVERNGDLVNVSACDPGGSAQQELSNGYDNVVQAAVTRSSLAASYYEDGTKVPNGPNGPIFTPAQVWCMASRVVSESHADELADLAVGKGSRYRALTLQAGAACGSNLVGQLFR
jgi:hypothetical protein